MHRLLITLGLAIATYGLAAAQIVFHHGSWTEILAQAAREDKLVFLDAYTSWCGPCKVMAAKTFTDSTVAAFYNAHFINAKIDMEKGDGPELVVRYDVRAYPTLIFVNSKGDLVHKVERALNPALFLALGQEVSQPDFASISLAKSEFAAHRDDRHAQAIFIARMTETYTPVDSLFARFRPSMADGGLLDADSWLVFKACFLRIESPEARYFVAHHADFVRKFGAGDANQKLLELYNSTLSHATYLHDETTYMATRKAFRASGLPEAEKLIAFQDLEWYLAANDWQRTIASAHHAVELDPELPPHVLARLADLVAKGAQDPRDLETALAWANQACAAEHNFENLEVQATLLHQLGRKREAIATAQEAIVLARAAKEPYGGLEDELNEWLQDD